MGDGRVVVGWGLVDVGEGVVVVGRGLVDVCLGVVVLDDVVVVVLDDVVVGVRVTTVVVEVCGVAVVVGDPVSVVVPVVLGDGRGGRPGSAEPHAVRSATAATAIAARVGIRRRASSCRDIVHQPLSPG